MAAPLEITVRLADGGAFAALLCELTVLCDRIDAGTLVFGSEIRDEVLAALERFCDDDDAR